MASVTKRGNSYRILVSNGYDSAGKKIQSVTTFTPDPKMTLRQQEKALDKFVYEFEEKVKSGKYLDGEKVSLKDFTERWLVDYAAINLEPTTLEVYKQNLLSKILPTLGHIKLAKLQPMHLQSFYNNMLEDGVRQDKKKGGYSPATIKKCHVIISSIMQTAVHWQVVESNPCDRVTPPKNGKNIDDIKYFNLEQAEIFLNALEMEYVTVYKAHDRVDDTGKTYHVPNYTEKRSIPTQFKVFFQIALFGGLRRGELLALKWSDVDFGNNSISITKATGLVKNTSITKAPKSKTSIRTITVPGSVMELIKKYKTEQNELRLSLGDQWVGDDYLFIQWNGAQISPSTPYHTFKDIIKKYNATVEDESLKLPDIPMHGLRHTSATLLIAENIDVRTVSARLGHAQASTTMNIYAHSLKKLDEKAADTLENLFKKKA